MATKSTRAPARRKTESVTKPQAVQLTPNVVASIIPLSDERRIKAAQAIWSDALKVYLGTLSDDDFNIANHIIKFVTQKPLSLKHLKSCEVLLFPGKNNL